MNFFHKTVLFFKRWLPLLRTLYPFDQLVKLKPAKSPAQLSHIPVELVPAFDEGRLKTTQHELEENDNGKLPSNLRPFI